MPPLSAAFVVQGEGRGHMTQALALAAHLRAAGHVVRRVLVGRSAHRPVPDYFRDGIGAPVLDFQAPTQLPGADRRGLSVFRTLVDALKRGPEFLKATATIAEATSGVDVVVNLLDLMGGISRRLYPSSVPCLAIAHNHLFLHTALADAPGPQHVRRMVMAYARATAAGSDRTVALSFRPMPRDPTLEVLPPLIRPGLDALDVSDGGYMLAYALNPGYGEELARWQAATPGAVVHCFVEGGAGALPGVGGDGFRAHELDAGAFLDRLAGCRVFVGSAGFEALCEAHYLGKPILAVPTEGHFEQTLNAWDAQRCGVARAGTYADLDDFWRNPDIPEPTAVEAFRDWVTSAPDLFVDAVERTARGHRTRTRATE